MSWNKYVVGENGAEATPSSEEKAEVVGAQVHVSVLLCPRVLSLF